MSSQEIHVFVSLGDQNHRVGKLWCHHRKGRESASFEYSTSWLNHPERFALEPALALTPGAFHTVADQGLFGAVGDSAPDRWGRILMRRAEAQRARASGVTPHTLGEADFLLGVDDEARQGALRFSHTKDGPFLAQGGHMSIPPLVDLPRLLSATERFLRYKEESEDLRLLLAPGASLGGARPKASVRDTDGHLAVAKFPHKDDEYSVVLWEAVALHLAQGAGLQVPSWRLETVMGKPVLLIRRFDRAGSFRIPFLSAMSLLQARDHEQHSYLEIADALCQSGSDPARDLAGLWRRIVFSILVSSTDDHLRNHGFLYERHQGWRLSPVYDLNPVPLEIRPRILTTTIDQNDGTASLDLALSVAGYFRLSQTEARTIIREVGAGVSPWRQVARKFGLEGRETDFMESAFDHDDARAAALL